MRTSTPEARTTCTARYHDTYSAYQNAKCRCPKARDDWRLYNKRRREGRSQASLVPAVGTHRRIKALVAIGWSTRAISKRLGWRGTPSSTLYYSSQVRRSTAAAVAALYDELWNVPGPSSRSIAAAKRNGWAPPLAWDDDTIDDPQAEPNLGAKVDECVDDVAVERVAAGEGRFGSLTRVEQVELYRRFGRAATHATLTRRWGVSSGRLAQIAELAGVAA